MNTVIKNFPEKDKDKITNNKLHNKFACFDMDFTLIRPKKEGRVFPIDVDDWMLLENVKDTLVKLHTSGWTIIVFTNKKFMNKRYTISEINKKFYDIRTSIGVPIYFMGSLIDDFYRKPFIGMWLYIASQFDNIIIDNNGKVKDNIRAFYCGDAYNINTYILKGADLKFAMNAGLPFIKPELMFSFNNISNSIDNHLALHLEYPKNTDVETNIFNCLKDNFNYIASSKYDEDLIKVKKILDKYKYIFIISSPASGKSTFCKTHLVPKGFTRLSKDDYKTIGKYKAAVINAVRDKKRIVFDNTNYTFNSRMILRNILEDEGIKKTSIGYIYRDVLKEDSMYINNMRHYLTKGEKNLLKDVAIHTYYKKLKLPDTNNEGDYITISHMIRKGDIPVIYF